MGSFAKVVVIVIVASLIAETVIAVSNNMTKRK